MDTLKRRVHEILGTPLPTCWLHCSTTDAIKQLWEVYPSRRANKDGRTVLSIVRLAAAQMPSSIFNRARVAWRVARGTAQSLFALRAFASIVRS